MLVFWGAIPVVLGEGIRERIELESEASGCEAERRDPVAVSIELMGNRSGPRPHSS
jgi:hypothetical protein